MKKINKVNSLRFWGLIFFFAVLMTAVVSVYMPNIHGPFVMDDIPNIVQNPNIKISSFEFSSIWRATNVASDLNYRRPLAYLSFGLNFLAGGLETTGYRVVNVTILLLSIPLGFWLVFLIAGSWFDSGKATTLAVGTMLIWTLHPILTNGISYVVQRMTSLCALFSLMSLALFFYGRRSFQSWKWYFGSGLFWILGLATKEIAILLPAVVFFYYYLTASDTKAHWRAWVGLIGIILGSQMGLLIFLKGFEARSFSILERLLTQGRVVLHYLSLFFLPLPSRLTLDYDYPLSTGLFSPPATIIAFLFHVLLISAALLIRKKRPLFSFGIISFYLLQLLESTIAPLEIIFEHRIYLPSFFLAMATMDFLIWVTEKFLPPARTRAIITAATVIIAGGLGILTYQRNLAWADPIVFFEDMVAKSPSSDRAHNNLGMLYTESKHFQKALFHFEKAVEINPLYGPAAVNLAVVYIRMGRASEALEHLKAVEKVTPRNTILAGNIHFNMGVCFQILGDLPQAVESYQKAANLGNGVPNAHYKIASIYYSWGRYETALDYVKQELTRNPKHREAQKLVTVLTKQLADQNHQRY